jgi:hypothetical protein
MARSIQRMGLKGTGPRRPSSPETEPNFYNMAPLTDGTSPPGAVSPVTHHASVELLVHGDSGSLLALADPSSRLALLHNTHGSAQGLQSHLHLSNGALHVDALPRMSTMEQALRVLLQRQTAAMPLPTSSSALDSVSHYNRLQAQLVLAQAAERRRAAAAAAAAVHPNGHGLLRELLGLQEPPPQAAPSVTTSDGHDALIREILLRNLLSNARSRGAI